MSQVSYVWRDGTTHNEPPPLTDLVERLRHWAVNTPGDLDIRGVMVDAANEIERLRRALDLSQGIGVRPQPDEDAE